MFDAKEYLEALEPPAFVDPNGRKHVGRILSMDQFQRFQAEIREARGDNPALRGRQLNTVMLAVVRAIFPWWRTPLRRSVASWVRRLPPAGQIKALLDFMGSQAKAFGTVMPTRGSGTDEAATSGSPTAG